MSAPEFTPWFPGNVRPARVGVYERRMPNRDGGFALWDGVKWRAWRLTAQKANCVTYGSANGFKPAWRGLASKP